MSKTTLQKLEDLRATLESEALLCERQAASLSGTNAARKEGMADAYEEAERALRDLISELEGIS